MANIKNLQVQKVLNLHPTDWVGGLELTDNRSYDLYKFLTNLPEVYEIYNSDNCLNSVELTANISEMKEQFIKTEEYDCFEIFEGEPEANATIFFSNLLEIEKLYPDCIINLYT